MLRSSRKYLGGTLGCAVDENIWGLKAQEEKFVHVGMKLTPVADFPTKFPQERSADAPRTIADRPGSVGVATPPPADGRDSDAPSLPGRDALVGHALATSYLREVGSGGRKSENSPAE